MHFKFSSGIVFNFPEKTFFCGSFSGPKGACPSPNKKKKKKLGQFSAQREALL
jgi:hypothetical protein